MTGTLLVTGGSSGVGAAIARLAAARGFDVAISYLTARDRAEAVAEAIVCAGRRVAILHADVRHEEEIKRLFEAIRVNCLRLGAIDTEVHEGESEE